MVKKLWNFIGQKSIEIIWLRLIENKVEAMKLSNLIWYIGHLILLLFHVWITTHDFQGFLDAKDLIAYFNSCRQ